MRSRLTLLAGAALALALSAAPAHAADRTPHCTIVGTNGPDVLRGTPGRDVICGRGGNDTLLGLGGDDVLIGGPGSDWLDGGPGHNTLVGVTDEDSVAGRQPKRPDVPEATIQAAVAPHPVLLFQETRRFGPERPPNCTKEFGLGWGSCGKSPLAWWGSAPALGEWIISWGQRGDGGVEITISSKDGENVIEGYLLGVARRDLYVTGGHVPAWGGLTAIAPSSDDVPTGKPGGPLAFQAKNQGGTFEYRIDISGYLSYAKVGDVRG
jgi:hypothetical protein